MIPTMGRRYKHQDQSENGKLHTPRAYLVAAISRSSESEFYFIRINPWGKVYQLINGFNSPEVIEA